MTEQQRSYDAGEVVYIICKLTRYSIANEAYAASDASAGYPTYYITDSAGTVLTVDGSGDPEAKALTNQSTGYYYIAYTIPTTCATGWVIVKFATESDNTIGYDGFLVKR